MAGEVYFGGFAFLGDAQNISKNYPYTSSIANSVSGAPSILDSALTSKSTGISNDSFALVFDRLGKLGPNSQSSVALAFALDRETVSVEKIAGLYKVLVELSAQVLFFDFNEKAIVASFPITVQYIDVKKHAPTQDEVRAIVHDLYVGTLGVNIFDEFAKTLSTVTLNTLVKRRIQVTSVSIGDAAHAVLPEFLASDEQNLKASIAQEFGKYLSLNQGIPVLPSSTGQAIRNRMAARFSDGSVFELKIPEPDYTIELDLANIKKVEFSKGAAGSTFVYGAYLHVKVIEPLSNKSYFDSTIKYGASKIVPASQENVDDWPAFQDALSALMDRFTIALKSPDAQWAEKYAGSKDVLADMEKLEKVLQTCR